MTESDYGRKIKELDQLLNDPDIPIQPHLVWSLLAELAKPDARCGLEGGGSDD